VIVPRWLGLLVALAAPLPALSQPAETEIPGVTAELVELRTHSGVTRLAVRYRNPGAAEAWSDRFDPGQIALVDAKSKQKHLPIRAADNQFVAGPLSDGSVYVKLPPGSESVAWVYFDAIPAGTLVSVAVPQMFPFDDVTVTEGAGTLVSAASARSTPHGAVATLVSAKRADQALKVRLKLAAEPGAEVRLADPYVRYAGVYLFDPASRRKYPLLRDSQGGYEAQPQTENMGGQSFLPSDWDAPILMSLTFQAPPDDVTSVDLVLPQFLPIEGVAIEGLGGAGAGGIAAAGTTLGLEGALKELEARVTPEEIAIDLSADVLFDFDKADLKPAAEQELNNLLTVVNSRPNARVSIEGHTDVRGEDAYNQMLSQRRAESVRAWLMHHGVAESRLTATGAGEARPVATGTAEADHQKNRRVEIRIQGA
jgi:outer membrane protein OmpA-like peptidoglycan-associated protein